MKLEIYFNKEEEELLQQASKTSETATLTAFAKGVLLGALKRNEKQYGGEINE